MYKDQFTCLECSASGEYVGKFGPMASCPSCKSLMIVIAMVWIAQHEQPKFSYVSASLATPENKRKLFKLIKGDKA